ncbi:hypothetical protein V6N12_029001 [Hibiscus sabdariffa]|uniref:Uncharacterized protein n=1 Tax=Hibiscus sabdariffa TaxID=183260 RepID=A0ABR2F7H1_9ROSI
MQRSDWLKEETPLDFLSSDLFKGMIGGTSHAGFPAQGVIGGGYVDPLFPLANLMARINPANNFSGDVIMTAIGEQSPIVPSEGIKRPRVQPHLSGVSTAADSLDSSDHSSAGLAQQVSRSQ